MCAAMSACMPHSLVGFPPDGEGRVTVLCTSQRLPLAVCAGRSCASPSTSRGVAKWAGRYSASMMSACTGSAGEGRAVTPACVAVALCVCLCARVCEAPSASSWLQGGHT